MIGRALEPRVQMRHQRTVEQHVGWCAAAERQLARRDVDAGSGLHVNRFQPRRPHSVEDGFGTCLRFGSDRDQIDAAAERHHVEVTEPFARHAQPVHERAVGAARILEPEIGAVAHDARVVARDAGDLDAKVVVGGRANPHGVADDGVTAGHGSGPSDDLHREARMDAAADGG